MLFWELCHKHETNNRRRIFPVLLYIGNLASQALERNPFLQTENGISFEEITLSLIVCQPLLETILGLRNTYSDTMALNKKNIVVIFLVGFVNYLEWAVVMTSIYPYILSFSNTKSSSAVYLSLAQSLFPLGQGISQPVASILVKKLGQVKIVLIGSLIIAIAGNVTYMAAHKADTVALIILGRALAGFGAGGGGILYGFIGANSSSESRTKYMSYYRVSCMAGVLSSTIASATFLPDFSRNVIGKATGLNEFTAPAALTILFLFICLILVTFVLNEDNCSSIGGSGEGTSVKRSLKSRGVLLSLMLYLLNGFVTTWIGFVMPLVAYNHFGFNLHRYGWLMVGVSATATVASLSMAQVSKSSCMRSNNGDWRSLVIAYTIMVTAIVISYLGGPSVLQSLPLTAKEGLFISGVILVFFTYSVAGVVLPSLMTKYVAKSLMPVIMPYGIAAMSAGKVIAPLLSRFEMWVQGWDLLFMGSVGLTLVGLLVFACLYHVPQPEEAPLLPDNRQTKSKEEPCVSSVHRDLINSSENLEEVSGYFDGSQQHEFAGNHEDGSP